MFLSDGRTLLASVWGSCYPAMESRVRTHIWWDMESASMSRGYGLDGRGTRPATSPSGKKSTFSPIFKLSSPRHDDQKTSSDRSRLRPSGISGGFESFDTDFSTGTSSGRRAADRRRTIELFLTECCASDQGLSCASRISSRLDSVEELDESLDTVSINLADCDEKATLYRQNSYDTQVKAKQDPLEQLRQLEQQILNSVSHPDDRRIQDCFMIPIHLVKRFMPMLKVNSFLQII